MNKGAIYAAAAYALWGTLPLYLHQLGNVPALQITAHRVVWSFLFLMVVVFLRRDFAGLRASLNRRAVLIFLGISTVLAVNWLVYVYGITSGFVVEASLGYFINPLVNVLLGMVFLRERLRPAQWFPIALAAAGVVYLTISHGSLPWLALALAVTFGIYGLLKKIAPLGSLYGLSLETATLLVPALGFLLFSEATGSGTFGHMSLQTSLLLAGLGVVTAIPLLLFASGARSVPLTTMGLLQYISPTLQFLSGVLLLGEAFTTDRIIGFSLIWAALAFFSIESFIARRRSLQAVAAQV